MATSKRNYRETVDKYGNKIVIADFTKITPAEEKAVGILVASGYKLKMKKNSSVRGDKITKEEMIASLKNDKENLAILNKKFADKENFMKIKKWYRTIKPL